MRIQATPQYFEEEGYIKGGAIYTTLDAKGIEVGCILIDIENIETCIDLLAKKIRDFVIYYK